MKSLEQQFKTLKSQTENELPLEGHQLRFQRKLAQHNRPATRLMNWISIAASITLLLGLSINTLPEAPKASAPLTATYQAQIDAQLAFLEVNYKATFTTPIQDIKLQLQELDQAYRALETKFNEQHQHPLLLKAMIDNLQHRLDILNELEQALKAQNEHDYENSIL
jgi:hypothetical protein